MPTLVDEAHIVIQTLIDYMKPMIEKNGEIILALVIPENMEDAAIKIYNHGPATHYGRDTFPQCMDNEEYNKIWNGECMYGAMNAKTGELKFFGETSGLPS